MYYTYAHYSPNGEIFYIGKGVGDRAYSFKDRNKDWKKAVKFYKGVIIKILAYWDNEIEAFNHEKLLIECFSDLNYKLVNKTKGGKGGFGLIVSEQTKQHLSKVLTGYKHKKITCPKCNKTGGQTSMKRWHFDNCQGIRPFKARASVDGKRIQLGTFATKEEATNKIIDFYTSINKPLPKEFIRHKGLG